MNKTYKDIKVRKSWGQLNPTSRIHGQGKEGFKPKFNKNDRKDWKRNLEY